MKDEFVVSTKDRLGSYDAIESAKPGEPLFPIQGGDPFGPATVLHWAGLARDAGLTETDEKLAAKLLGKATDAERVAWAMMAYQRGEESGPAPVVFDDDGQSREEREALIHGTGRLQHALATALEVAETLAGFRVRPEAEVKIRDAVELLREAAFATEPRRGQERS